MQMSFQNVLLRPGTLRCLQGPSGFSLRIKRKPLVPPRHFHLQFTSKRLEKKAAYAAKCCSWSRFVGLQEEADPAAKNLIGSRTGENKNEGVEKQLFRQPGDRSEGSAAETEPGEPCFSGFELSSGSGERRSRSLSEAGSGLGGKEAAFQEPDGNSSAVTRLPARLDRRGSPGGGAGVAGAPRRRLSSRGSGSRVPTVHSKTLRKGGGLRSSVPKATTELTVLAEPGGKIWSEDTHPPAPTGPH